MGIWLVDESDPAYLVGKYGIDGQGRLRDERTYRVRVDDDHHVERVLAEEGRVERFRSETRVQTFGDAGPCDGVTVGMWDARKGIGVVGADNFLNQKPITQASCELLSLYASSIGRLCSLKRAQEALRSNEERLRTIVGAMPVLLDAFDERGNIIYWNEECERTLGYSREDVIGDPSAMERFYPDDEYRKRVLQTVEKHRGDFRGMEFDIVCKDGTTRTIVWSNVSDRIAIPGWATWAVGVDITDRKKAEAERAQLEGRLRQSQKMEAVGQLAGGIAHDFNNLLQGILGYTEMAKADLAPDDQRCRDMEQVRKAAERAATLTRQLLAFSRRQVIQPVGLNLNDVIADISELIRRVIGEHIELKLEPGDDVGMIHADPGTLEQVFMNLCVNARDAMPSGGQLTIETDGVRVDDAFCKVHPWAVLGDYACLAVTDTGVGIPQEATEHIFEPFFTTKEVGKGTGLGLSMVYGIVKQHDGLIHCYSEVGKGSCFKIYLPKVDSVAVETHESAEASAPARGVETILLAEDDEIVRKLAVRVLEKSGYRVLAASDGEEALRLFEEHREEVQIALLDVVMPKAGGREVYEAIRAVRPELPVLFSSGYSTNAIHSGFVIDEGLHAIQKPYSPTDLLRKIRETLS